MADESVRAARTAVGGRASIGETADHEASQASKDRFRAVFDSVTDFALIVTDRRGRITEWNVGAERILGWSRAEMLGQAIERFFTPEDCAIGRALTEMRLSLEDGRASDERWHLRRDGTRFWASGEMMPLHDEHGNDLGFVKVLRDRTAQHLAGEALEATEGRLRESEEHLRYTVELNPAVPWTCDPQGNITSYSQRWLDLTGQAPGEPYGNGWAKVLHPDDLAPTFEAFSACLATGEPVDVDYRIRVAATGEYRWMRARARPRRGDDGEIVRWYGVVEDVHDRKVAEARLCESEARARSLAEEQRALGAALAAANATLEQRVEERTRDLDRLWRLSTDLMLVANFEGRIEAVNPAWSQLLGWGRMAWSAAASWTSSTPTTSPRRWPRWPPWPGASPPFGSRTATGARTAHISGCPGRPSPTIASSMRSAATCRPRRRRLRPYGAPRRRSANRRRWRPSDN